MTTHGRRRALGQHFLKDQRACERIADIAADLVATFGAKSLLEIGPGKGAITEPLLKRVSGASVAFVLAEKDRVIARTWAQRADSRFEVLEGDILDVPTQVWGRNPPVVVASNLPYSSGTAILQKLARERMLIPGMVLMFQAEVARRLRAEPGSKAWGSLSIWIQNWWDVKKLFNLSPGAFQPPPEVDSEVVVFTRRSEPRIAMKPEDEAVFEELLKSGFAHRRKMLRSGFSGKASLENALALSKVDGTKRAEALQWDEWDRLFRAYAQIRAR